MCYKTDCKDLRVLGLERNRINCLNFYAHNGQMNALKLVKANSPLATINIAKFTSSTIQLLFWMLQSDCSRTQSLVATAQLSGAQLSGDWHCLAIQLLSIRQDFNVVGHTQMHTSMHL